MTILLAFFAFLALLYLTRGTPIERIRDLDPHGRLAVPDSFFAKMVEAQIDTDLEHGNHVEVLFDGDGIFPRLFGDLQRARDLITWHVFWFKPGEVADQLKQILVERSRAGVQVLLLQDLYGSWGIPESYFRELRDAGAEVATGGGTPSTGTGKIRCHASGASQSATQPSTSNTAPKRGWRISACDSATATRWSRTAATSRIA
ncbi:MAG TPA: hypothetical protein VMT16_16485 [Thermoanaerobaculia bacterium]|nr:hypothetical protein [Thermoanaerobaculia bacterium]